LIFKTWYLGRSFTVDAYAPASVPLHQGSKQAKERKMKAERIFWIILLLSSDLVAQELTPEYCRRAGVQVWDNTPITGRVKLQTFNTYEAVNAACGIDIHKSLKSVNGCAIPLNGNEWHIAFTNACTEQHERCHALYQVADHTKVQSIPLMRWAAGCERVDIYQGG
jgi:hypothetical protein